MKVDEGPFELDKWFCKAKFIFARGLHCDQLALQLIASASCAFLFMIKQPFAAFFS